MAMGGLITPFYLLSGVPEYPRAQGHLSRLLKGLRKYQTLKGWSVSYTLKGLGVSVEQDFLNYFDGKHVFCAIDDKRTNQVPTHYHEGYDLSRDQILTQLHTKNSENYGIFFTVNEIDRKQDPQRQRTTRMLRKIRAVWADDDIIRKEPRSDFPIPPNIVIETSEGRYHYYWLTTTDEIGEWGGVMNHIANTYDTDGNAKDLVRVLRVPGFMHNKREPTLSKAYLGNNTHYGWAEIVKAFPPDKIAKIRNIANAAGVHGNARFESFSEARLSITSGSNFHGAIMWLLNHWVNGGIKSPVELKTLIVDLMNLSVVQDERWDARINDEYLTNNINDAINFVKENPIIAEIAVPEIDGVHSQLNTGYPPGLMGKLCGEIYEMAPHPNEEVALMAAFALVAGITGRTYNVLGTGLNLYVALLADSGVGKANLKNSINIALMVNCALEGGIAFKGASRFTGPKALFDMLLSGLSRVCVLEESGLMSESTAGDQKGLIRVMLDIFSSSGKGEFAGGENYSKVEQNVPVIPSPALTIAHVSTPLSYLRALKAKDATVSGDIARIWMMRSMRDKQPLNIDRRENFSTDVILRIKELVKKCIPQQSPKGHEVVDIDTSYINIQRDSDRWTDLENQYKRSGDQLRRTLTSRAFVKILKVSALSSIFNNRFAIGVDEYKWAEDSINGEITTIEDAVSFGASDDMMSVVKGIIIPVISKIINCKYDDLRKTPPKVLKGKGIFTSTNFTQCLRNNEVLKRMNDDPERPNPRSGIEKILGYMMRNGLLLTVPSDKLAQFGTKARVGYKVTDDFILMMED